MIRMPSTCAEQGETGRGRSTYRRLPRLSSPEPESPLRSTGTGRFPAGAEAPIVLGALGVNIQIPPERVQDCVNRHWCGLPVRPALPPGDEICRESPRRAGRADDLQHARAHHKPCGCPQATRRARIARMLPPRWHAPSDGSPRSRRASFTARMVWMR